LDLNEDMESITPKLINLDRQILQIYRAIINEKSLEQVKEVSLQHMNNINAFLVHVSDCFLNLVITKQGSKELRQMLEKEFDMTFFKVIPESKYWIWEAVSFNKGNLQLNHNQLMLNYLLNPKDHLSINLLALYQLK